jgi:hypothetical protein
MPPLLRYCLFVVERVISALSLRAFAGLPPLVSWPLPHLLLLFAGWRYCYWRYRAGQLLGYWRIVATGAIVIGAYHIVFHFFDLAIVGCYRLPVTLSAIVY